MCKITFFAGLAEKIGKTNDIIEVNWQKGTKTKDFFISKYPILNNQPFTVAINMELMENFPELEVDEIILLPPFAGG